MRGIFRIPVIAMCLISLLVLGCGVENTSKNEPIAANNTTDNAIVLAAYRHLAPGERDGYYCSKVLDVWEPLITSDDSTGRPRPCLAVNWEMLEDGKVWRFYLRRGVVFHDGSPFNADTVLSNMDRLKKGIKRSNFYLLSLNNFYPNLENVVKVDDYTVEMTFSTPNINQLYNMINFGSAMFAPSCIAEDGNFSGVAIGTGPFRIAENVLNRYVVLERNEDYYGEKAGAEKIIIRNIPNPDTRYAAMKSEEIMGVIDLNAMPPVLATELKKDERFELSVSRSLMIRFLALNGTKPPFDDVRMRQAISLLIDRQVLIDSLYMGYAKPTTNVLNYTSPFYREFPVLHDVETAKQLANEVLKGNNYKLIYLINGSDPLQKGEAELIAYWLEQIGLEVEIQAMEYAVMASLLKRGDYHIARSQQGLPNGDPEYVFKEFMMPEGRRNKESSLGYENAEVGELMKRVRVTVDENARQDIFTRIQEISTEELPVVPLYYDENIVAYNKKLTGYQAKVYGITLAKVRWR